MKKYNNLEKMEDPEAEKWAKKRLEFLNEEIWTLTVKIDNGTGWFLESNLVKFRKERYKYITHKEELLEEFPQYFL